MNDHDRLIAVKTAAGMNRMTSTQRVILAAFAAMVDDNGCLTMHVAAMARTLNFPRRTIQRSLPYMVDKGYIEILPQGRQCQQRGGNGNIPYVFRLGSWAFDQAKVAA